MPHSATSRRRRRLLTDAEREQRRREQRQLVIASIEQLRCSDGWQAYLRARRRFHHYSPRNILLILSQHPTAEHIAGFRAWLDLGYCVRTGERAIRIWAPCPPSRNQLQAWRQAGADPDNKPRTFWRLAPVFAQDQVQELPPPAAPTPLSAPVGEISGDSHAQLVDQLTAFAQAIGYPVRFEDTGCADGSCNHARRQIRIADRLEPNGQVATLIHELAHALVYLERGDGQPREYDYAGEELIVESVAFSCCQTAGLDTSANSIPYLASWAENASLDVLEHAAQLTGQIADRIDTTLAGNTEEAAASERE